MCLPILQVVALPMVALIAIVIGTTLLSKSILSKVDTSREVSAKFAMLAQTMKYDVIQVQQWLTDISATRGLDGLDDGFDEAAASKASFLRGLSEFRNLFESNGNSEQLAELQKIQTEFDTYYEVGLVMAHDYVQQGPEGGNAHMANFDQAAEELSANLEQFVADQKAALNQNLSETQALAANFNRIIQITGFTTLCLWLVFMYGFVRKVILPLKKVATVLSGSADQLSATSSQVHSSSQSLAEGASEQAASLEETSASLEEMTSMLKKTEEAARQAKTLSNETSTAAASGSADMSEMKTAMGQIQASSADVAQIVKDIDEIAFQTNILALNAAVEAARAGEAGMGFAVVADEVRNLALRSAKSAKETASKIEESISRSERGVTISNKVAESFALIAERTVEVDRYVSEIASASQEQSQGVNQVNIAISQMNEVTQSNAANSEESASASDDLNAQSQAIKDSVKSLQQLVGVEKTIEKSTTPLVRKTRAKQASIPQSFPASKPGHLPEAVHSRNGGEFEHNGRKTSEVSSNRQTSMSLNGNNRNGNTTPGDEFLDF
jgi:methyl-accepting chemotaxis protein